ncbi:hypothetical protein [Rhodopirellula bahusiensis]|uniref:hypothetical protein n=1 Tax=Rhodopirellula bahusiensis TaxID=2014065 RepID=UPI003265E374
MKQFLHISPNVPPAICGVGDYAATVGSRMEQLQPGLECRYLAAGYRSAGESLREPSPEWFWERVKWEIDSSPISSAGIVLHYSGYGYSPDGAPDWIADAFDNRPAFAMEISIVTFFHELYATGWPWKRAYWYSRRQRDVAKRIAQASDALFTNRRESADWLEKATGSEPGSVLDLPVPSNVGEPDDVPGYFDRPPQAVLFGGKKIKQPFLAGRGAVTTATICRKLGIRKVLDIGSPIELSRKPFDDEAIEVIQMGFLDAEEVSKCLLQSKIGFFDYNPKFITKSGVLAALASHGVAIVSPQRTFNAIEELASCSDALSLESLAHSAQTKELEVELANHAATGRRYSARSSARQHALSLLKACFSHETSV